MLFKNLVEGEGTISSSKIEYLTANANKGENLA